MRSLLNIFVISLVLGVSAHAFAGPTLAQNKKAGANPPPVAPPAQPVSEARTIESQPPMQPPSQPGQDQFEKNPAEAIAMVCEVMTLLRSAEAAQAQAQDPALQKSAAELVASRRRELKAVMSVYKKQTGRHLDVAANCPAQ